MSGPDLDTAMDKLEIAVETAESEKSEDAYKELNEATRDARLICALVGECYHDAVLTIARQVRILDLMQRALDVIPKGHIYQEHIIDRLNVIHKYTKKVQEKPAPAGNPS